MTTRAKKSGNAGDAAKDANLKAGGPLLDENFNNIQNPDDSDNIDDGFSWEIIMNDVESGKTRDDIVRECLADAKHFRRVNNIHIKNVKAFARLAKDTGRVVTRLTFVVKERIPGMVVDEANLDAFGMPTKKLGGSNNIFTSAYAVSGAMKESAKSAIFADSVANMTAVLAGADEREITGKANIANTLYAGGIMDVICQFVPANTPYRNPFSSMDDDSEANTFDEDRIFHHVVRLQFGEVGEDAYKVRLIP
jgi:hypothetical protein